MPVEHVAAGDWVTAERVEQSIVRMCRDGHHVKESEQPGIRGQVGCDARLGHVPRACHDRVKFAEDLRGQRQRSRRIRRRFKHSARGGVLWSVRVEGIDETFVSTTLGSTAAAP